MPWTGGWINKLWYSHTTEHFSPKKYLLLTYPTNMGESQKRDSERKKKTQKSTCERIPCVWILRTSRLTCGENADQQWPGLGAEPSGCREVQRHFGKWWKHPSLLPEFEGTAGVPFEFSLAKLTEKDLQERGGKVPHPGSRTTPVGNWGVGVGSSWQFALFLKINLIER